jgi:hypothetical protein
MENLEELDIQDIDNNIPELVDETENNIEYDIVDVAAVAALIVDDDIVDDDIVPLEFLLEIQEISGKNIAQNYVDDLSSKFEKLKLRYDFEVVPNDEEVELNKYIGGSDLTFPYNYFDSFASSIKRVLNKNSQSLYKNKNYILNLFEKKSKEKSELAVEVVEEEKPIETVTIDNNDKKKSTIVLPKQYTGLIKIYLTIYDKSNMSSKSVGRIYDLNKWLENNKIIK